jgi:2-iminobutanoate/2-iminopropanoate deaminase
MRRIQTNDAPSPGGHYAQGVSHGGFLFVSGQLPIDAKTGEKKTGAIEEQTQQVLDNVLAIVVAAGGDKSHIVKTTVYVSDIELWERVNEVYAEFFGLYRPARAIVPVKELHHGFQIEIEAVAALP